MCCGAHVSEISEAMRNKNLNIISYYEYKKN